MSEPSFQFIGHFTAITKFNVSIANGNLEYPKSNNVIKKVKVKAMILQQLLDAMIANRYSKVERLKNRYLIAPRKVKK